MGLQALELYLENQIRFILNGFFFSGNGMYKVLWLLHEMTYLITCLWENLLCHQSFNNKDNNTSVKKLSANTDVKNSKGVNNNNDNNKWINK